MDLGRDKINEELSVGSKRVGIGIGIGRERELFPEVFESWRNMRGRVWNQRLNGSAEAPVPPSNRKHYHSRSHPSQLSPQQQLWTLAPYQPTSYIGYFFVIIKHTKQTKKMNRIIKRKKLNLCFGFSFLI